MITSQVEYLQMTQQMHVKSKTINSKENSIVLQAATILVTMASEKHIWRLNCPNRLWIWQLVQYERMNTYQLSVLYYNH